jgi:hypothetical protein
MSSPSPSSPLLDRADSAQLNSWMSTVVLRPAGPEDREAVAALAALDNAEVPRHPVLLLEEDGHLRAARSLRDGATISDPFASTEHLRPLLSAHATLPKRPGRVREFFRRQSQLWESHATGRSWGTSGTDALTAMRRARPLLDS